MICRHDEPIPRSTILARALATYYADPRGYESPLEAVDVMLEAHGLLRVGAGDEELLHETALRFSAGG
jgi:hypothetical protein